jgi:protein-S-isoprenylcysteine O-methyltransferase Ste14
MSRRAPSSRIMATRNTALLTTVSTLIYLGLAIAGWGGISPFFAHPARIALTIVLFALAGAALFTEGNLSAGEREARSNRWVITAFTAIGFLDAFVPAYTDRADLWTIDGDTVRWLGVALFAVGGILRLWPVFVLGRRFSGLVAIQPGHTLVTTGIYSTIRHPSYLGLIVSTFGWGLAFRSWAGVVLAGLTIPILIARMNAEEALLRSQFGSDYEGYCGRTARLVPGLY